METKNCDPITPLSTVLKYKELAKDPFNHAEMVKDKTTIHFLTYVLDSSDEEVLKTSLDTLELLCENSSNSSLIESTFGVVEALTVLINSENLVNAEIKEKGQKLLERLKNSDSSTKPNKVQSKNMKVLILHIHGLHLETQKELEDILMKKMKGIHSVVVDVEHQKCTLTVFDSVDPKNIATVLSENTDMEAKLVTRNKRNQEILVPLIEDGKTLHLEDLPPYLDEKDSPVKEKAVRSAKDIRITASEWFCSAAGFLQRTFYW